MASNLIVSTGTVANAPGRCQQSRLFWAANTNKWWCFYRISTDTTHIYVKYSSDLVTWSTPTNNTFTLLHANTGNWDMGVFYANLGSTDVFHISFFYANIGSTDYWTHLRATVSGTTVTWGTESAQQNHATNGDPLSAMTALASDGSVWDLASVNGTPSHSGDFTLAQSAHTDSGSAWTTGFNAITDITDSVSYFQSGALLPLASGGKVMAVIGEEDGTLSSAYWSLWGGSSWSPTGNNGIFGSSGSYSPNDWGLCRRTDADIHAVRRNNSTSTFSHVRWNGTSWGAGQSIPNTTCKAAAGVALVSDGTDVWAFIIDSAAGNAVKYCKWSSSGSTWAASWTTLDSTSKVRSNLTAVYASGPLAIAVCWAQTNGSNFDLTVEALSLAPLFTLGRRTQRLRVGSRGVIAA